MKKLITIFAALFLMGIITSGCSGDTAEGTDGADNPCADNPCADNPCADNPCADNGEEDSH